MKLNTILLWLARISGTLVLAFVLFFVLAYTIGPEEQGGGPLSTHDMVTFIFFPVSTIVGLALALKWEGIGGAITVFGMISLIVIRPDLASSALIMAIGLIPGLLYLSYWLLSRRVYPGSGQY